MHKRIIEIQRNILLLRPSQFLTYFGHVVPFTAFVSVLLCHPKCKAIGNQDPDLRLVEYRWKPLVQNGDCS